MHLPDRPGGLLYITIACVSRRPPQRETALSEYGYAGWLLMRVSRSRSWDWMRCKIEILAFRKRSRRLLPLSPYVYR